MNMLMGLAGAIGLEPNELAKMAETFESLRNLSSQLDHIERMLAEQTKLLSELTNVVSNKEV